jgi:hypothetical protein
MAGEKIGEGWALGRKLSGLLIGVAGLGSLVIIAGKLLAHPAAAEHYMEWSIYALNIVLLAVIILLYCEIREIKSELGHIKGR